MGVQYRVFPLLASAYAMHFTALYMRRIYNEYMTTGDNTLLKEV